MKYNIGDFVKDSVSKTLLIIATKKQKLDYIYLKQHKLNVVTELTENISISVENGFDYKAVEVESFDDNGNVIFDKQSNIGNYFENDLYI